MKNRKMVKTFRLSKQPELSKNFKVIYKKWFDRNCERALGLSLVDGFLAKNPTYPEAIVFKARLLIGTRNQEALKLLRLARRVDEWRVVYAFDEAEVLYRLGRKKEALKSLSFGVEKLLSEIDDGLSNFLLGIGADARARRRVKQHMVRNISQYLSRKSAKLALNTFLSTLRRELDQMNPPKL